uniref:Uncharacterized protein n=1 Tax=Candidatus Methanogaster sp. ANME-2c ERB4 TaxID=2759911 RepID=A0A7G9YG83_9EURY|nr:hypothetical protein JMDIOONB_00029 [Methanosarcinales archaeon ANME-2c ERB4]
MPVTGVVRYVHNHRPQYRGWALMVAGFYMTLAFQMITSIMITKIIIYPRRSFSRDCAGRQNRLRIEERVAPCM